MQEQTFLTKKDQLGYEEEHVIIKLRKGNELLNYSLSSSLEDIEIAIFSRTGHNIDLDKALWKLNPYLSVSVKHLMKKNHAIYSMTTWQKGKNKHLVVNMYANDKWFISGFDEYEGAFLPENQVYLLRMIDKFFPDDDKDN